MIDLATVWFGILVFSLFMYVVLDGFDLGIGLLYLFFPDEKQRDVMMDTVAPVWDGNETWLVMGGAGLFGAFPLAYGVLLSYLALPLTLMVLALIFRGVAFEFRHNADPAHKPLWSLSFIFGSFISVFMQGVVVGAIVQGIPPEALADQSLLAWHWLSAFTLFTGLGLTICYALLGCSWLILKTQNTLQQKMYAWLSPLVWLQLLVIGIISLWTPLMNPTIWQRWFSLPNLIIFMPVPLCIALISFLLLRSHQKGWQLMPFLGALAIIVLGLSGLSISLWPYLVPPLLDYQTAAAPDSSLLFMLIGAALILPVILIYTGWNYYVFRGKVHEQTKHY